jgi:mRNA interferase ChpB
VLVVSPDAFNAATQTPVVVPVTTGGAFARARGFAVSLAGAGTRTAGVIRCDQPRTIDLTARKASLLERVPPSIMDEILAKLATIIA